MRGFEEFKEFSAGSKRLNPKEFLGRNIFIKKRRNKVEILELLSYDDRTGKAKLKSQSGTVESRILDSCLWSPMPFSESLDSSNLKDKEIISSNTSKRSAQALQHKDEKIISNLEELNKRFQKHEGSCIGAKSFTLSQLHEIHDYAREGSAGQTQTRDVWSVRIMPESADGLIIATCGGFTVCIIHVDQEKTVMRYTNPEDSFFCSLAWSKPLRTTLSENYKTTYSLSAEGYCMLAAGTTNGAIHLLLPSCLLCVDLLQRHSQVVTALQFHPKHKTLLLSGSADKTCIVWSISLLTSDKQATNTVALKIIQVGDEIASLCFTDDFFVILGKGGFAVQYSADPKNFSRQPSSNPLTCFRNHFILVDCVRGLPQNQISCIVPPCTTSKWWISRLVKC
jgi:hypothetical protein